MRSTRPTPASAAVVVRGVSATPVAGRVLSAGVALRWLIRMRWHMVGGQVLALASSAALAAPVQLAPLLALLGGAAASNAALSWWLSAGRPAPRALVGLVVLADTASLTGVLAAMGGPENPFVTLFVVLAAVAAFLLDRRWTALVVAAVALGHGLLLARAPGAPGGRLGAHLLGGRWVAVVLASTVVAVVVRRLAQAVHDREEALRRAERSALRAGTLASLGTLAAGAAHELNTPLGTIALASSELGSLVHTDPVRAEEDAALIGEQVERCRAIVQRMAARSSEQLAEPSGPVTIASLVERALAAVAPADRPRVRWDAPAAASQLAHVAPAGAAQALTHLIGNGLDATRDQGGRVDVAVAVGASAVAFVVADDGPGVAPELRSRLGEPFLTTKGPGQGMGLGLFLCQAFVDRWGGSLSFDYPAPGGTTARLELPRHPEPRP